MTTNATKSSDASDNGRKSVSVSLPTTQVTLAESVGERIKWARERKDITQKELARLSGKSRASVVQYEQNKIAAPLDVIATLAEKLDVAPEYLAFGRSGISGIRNAEEEIQVLEELSSTNSGNQVLTGGWAIPRSMFEDYDGPRRSIKVALLGIDEPKFDMKRGDRVVIDTSAVVNKDGLYLVKTPFGFRIVHVSVGFSTKTEIRASTGSGEQQTLYPSDLDLVGHVIGVFRRTF